MSLPKPEPLCRYHYDPLDRLADSSPLGQAGTRCFYRLNRLTTEIQGQIGTSWLQTQDRLLAQWQQEADMSKGVLIATDAPGSVIHALGADQPHAFGYTLYGTRVPVQAPLHLPGFNGQRRDPVTGHYLLGNGYRAFNPMLMRFNSPDSLSPFGEGGLNAYGYCMGDPVNRLDPNGHVTKLGIYLLQRPLKYSDHMLLNDFKQLRIKYTHHSLQEQALSAIPSGLRGSYLAHRGTPSGLKKIITPLVRVHPTQPTKTTRRQFFNMTEDQIKIHFINPRTPTLEITDLAPSLKMELSERLEKIYYSYFTRRFLERTDAPEAIEREIAHNWPPYQYTVAAPVNPVSREMRNQPARLVRR